MFTIDDISESLKMPIKCFCIWTDLLGFGAPYEKAKWKINSDSIENAFRLYTVNEFLSSTTLSLCEKTFSLNDGVCRLFDFNSKKTNPFYFSLWLIRIMQFHYFINSMEKKSHPEHKGFPGARSVFTSGERVSLFQDNRFKNETKFLGNSVKLKSENEKQIVNYTPSEFQLNLAFSKAYFMEGSGSKFGLNGSKIFFEVPAIIELRDYFNNLKVKYSDIEFVGILKDAFGFDINYSTFFSSFKTYKNAKIFKIDIKQQNQNRYTLLEIYFLNKQVKFSNRGIETELLVASKYRYIHKDRIVDSRRKNDVMSPWFSLIEYNETKTSR